MIKRGWIILILLVLPICFAKEVNIIETFESEKNIGETTYYYAGSKLIATKNNDNVQYEYQDRLGSDVESNSLPFGEEIKTSERFSFTGKELDEELYYFNARYYDSKLGRFTSVDPVAGNNPYAYVENNPMNFVDPDGKEAVRYTWAAPTTGSPVNRYKMQGRFAQGAWTNLGYFGGIEYTFDIPDQLLAMGFELQVAGIDLENRQGPYSLPSNIYYGATVDLDEGTLRGSLITPYPNPASGPYATIKYYIPEGTTSDFNLEIFNLRGESVKQIDVDPTNIGYNEFKWNLESDNGQDVSSGVYVIRYSFKYEFFGTIIDSEGQKFSEKQITNPTYNMPFTVIR